MSKYNLIVVLGGPASGKGTQCALLTKSFSQLVHVSVGDLVRTKRDLDSELNKKMASGQLLPTPFIGSLIVDHIKTSFDKSKTILLDGFPRNKDNYDYLCNEMIKDFNLVCVLQFDCSDEVMVQRAISRGKESGRLDDNKETCIRRIKTYHVETEKIIEFFDKSLIKKSIVKMIK